MSKFKDMETEEGMLLWRECFQNHINILAKCERLVRESNSKRAIKLYPLFSAIIEDSISLDLLATNSRVNQCYIISRALLERVINLSYLLYAPDDEYNSFVDYTKNKAARSLSRKIEIEGQKKVSLEFSNDAYELPQDYKDAVDRFTSAKGREIPRWTKLSIDKRADFLDKKSGKNLLMHVLMIYGDASEALHGTLYGALFHYGLYNPSARPKDKSDFDREKYNTLSFLYLMGSGAIGTLLFCLKENGVEVNESYLESKLVFNNASEESGLAEEARRASRKI
ncbi:hypothetical protein J8L98_14300 [Pseudoalteromonas sp. MMG013]|uniref:DUF5677 domain-containing protein n=1 Tax=Pseudoalteromonas sp. MMG013 TaxID=2822687 RepID=UPI001B37FB07|nr:DUF5677 domain-containing protein [Pseudoalteromonas sp. MMG013]MBQ4862854.1 hypothetical protein [Pseudoalteromonas sp. MMG013]